VIFQVTRAPEVNVPMPVAWLGTSPKIGRMGKAVDGTIIYILIIHI
jgi:hypothetical protein